MLSQALFKLEIAEAVLSSIQGETRASQRHSRSRMVVTSSCAVTEASIQKLAALFPDTLLLAALDLVDRDRGSSTFLHVVSTVLLMVLVVEQLSSTQPSGVALTTKFSDRLLPMRSFLHQLLQARCPFTAHALPSHTLSLRTKVIFW